MTIVISPADVILNINLLSHETIITICQLRFSPARHAVGENEDERFHISLPFIIYLNSTAYSVIIV